MRRKLCMYCGRHHPSHQASCPNAEKTLFWDDEKCWLYWTEWEYTGNNDIPHRRYIGIGLKGER